MQLLPTVAFVNNAPPESGVGLRAAKIVAQLVTSGEFAVTQFYIDGTSGELLKDGVVVLRVRRWPGMLGSKTITWIRLGRKLRRHLRDFDLVHAGNQTLSFILPSVPFVVTVHDIIELTEPQSGFGGLAARYLYRGLPRADRLIAVSEFTKQAVVDHFAVAPEKISVVYNGVDADFQVIEKFTETIGYQTLRRELRLGEDSAVVLYVGSDHPRKNVVSALRAFADVLKTAPHAIFVKVGAAGLPAGRRTTLEVIDELQIRDSVRLIDTVSTDRLHELYNLANVLVFPSLYEGFGLPPLQAMKSGTPVVTSNSTSLPEVVGDAGLTCDPQDTTCLEDSLTAVLTDSAVAAKLSADGLARARQFTWEDAGVAVANVYRKALL